MKEPIHPALLAAAKTVCKRGNLYFPNHVAGLLQEEITAAGYGLMPLQGAESKLDSLPKSPQPPIP